MREGYRHFAQRHICEEVSEHVHERERRDAREERLINLGSLVKAERPHRDGNQTSDSELQLRTVDRVRKDLQHLFVVDVENNVCCVPQREEHAEQYSFRGAAILLRRAGRR